MFVKITLATSYKPNICGTNRRMQATETGSVETSHNPASSFLFGACFELAFFGREWCVFCVFLGPEFVGRKWVHVGFFQVFDTIMCPFFGPGI